MSRPLRILQVIPSMGVGGAEVFVARLAAAHQAAGHDVHLLHFRDGPMIERLDPLLRARLHHLPKGARYDLRLLPRIARLLRHLRPDVVHTHLFPALAWAGAAARLTRVPAWVHTHHGNHLPDQRDSRLLETTLLARAHRVVAVSEGTATFLRQRSGRLADVLTIRNGIPLQDRPRSALDGDPPLLGTVGRMVPIKAQADLITAVGLLRDDGVHVRLRLVGDGELRPDLEALTDRLDLRDRVHFTGRVTDVPDQLAALDAFVLPSLSEAMPLALLEACAAGLPVLVTENGGAGAIIDEGAGGWRITPGAPPALAARIRDFLALSQQERQAYGQRSFDLVQSRYSMTACAESYLALYAELLGK